MPNKSTFSINKKGAIITFRANGDKITAPTEDRIYELWRETLSFLGSIGFYVCKDKRIEKDYKILSRTHRQGRYCDLEFKTSTYPAGFEIKFFQNVNYENPHGGEYDCDKYAKMPYLVKKQFENACRKIRKFFADKGIEDASEYEPRTAEEKIKWSYVKNWHKPQSSMDFALSDIHGTTAEAYNSKDRDGNILRNGEVKYFRDYNGYLCRGIVYHNINNMWWVICGNQVRNVASFDLFDLADNDNRGRSAIVRIPAKYKARRDQLEKATEKELRNELKRRQRARRDLR